MNNTAILTDQIESIESSSLKIKSYAIAFASSYVTENERNELMNMIISQCNCVNMNCEDLMGILTSGDSK